MGTKRITVKQFRAKGDKEAENFWWEGNWPFDEAKSCGTCFTQHYKHVECHSEIRRIADDLGVNGLEYWVNRGAWLKKNATKLFALRKKFDRLYAASPSEVCK